ncbi:hypothetical protein JCM15765_17840 [Paradesulfitobacterium aromaticivorans]
MNRLGEVSTLTRLSCVKGYERNRHVHIDDAMRKSILFKQSGTTGILRLCTRGSFFILFLCNA